MTAMHAVASGAGARDCLAVQSLESDLSAAVTTECCFHAVYSNSLTSKLHETRHKTISTRHCGSIDRSAVARITECTDRLLDVYRLRGVAAMSFYEQRSIAFRLSVSVDLQFLLSTWIC